MHSRFTRCLASILTVAVGVSTGALCLAADPVKQTDDPTPPAAAAESTLKLPDVTAQSPAKWIASDTLDPGDEPGDDARDCLDGLIWKPAEFDVTCTPPARPDHGDLLVRFASPAPFGDELNDLVAMEWYVARDQQQQPVVAPAIVVVHESGSGMTVGRLIAKGLCQRGLHTFMIQLPFYGERRAGRPRPDGANLVTLVRQAVADVRRARDAVAVLPLVDPSHIGLQGTSLGGFVTATTAGLDDGYDSVFIMLAGGRIFDVIQNGQRDSAKVREQLEKAGLTGDTLRELTLTIEPMRLAHRFDPDRTWMYSGRYDNVVPIENSIALADAAGLAPVHHIRMLADHYSGIVYLPFVLTHIRDKVRLLHSQTEPQ